MSLEGLAALPWLTPTEVDTILKGKTKTVTVVKKIVPEGPCKSHSSKGDQIHRVLKGLKGLKIYEAFGELEDKGVPGWCTQAFEKYGEVTSKWTKDGHARNVITAELQNKEYSYDCADFDAYGISLLLELLRQRGALRLLKPSGVKWLFVTYDGINASKQRPGHVASFVKYFKTDSPTDEQVDGLIKDECRMYGFKAELADQFILSKQHKTKRQAWKLTHVDTGYRTTMDAVGEMREVLDA